MRISALLGTATDPRRGALGVLAFCFAMGLTARGMVESFVVFLLPLARSFGWDRASVVSIYSLSALASGLVAPLVGRLFDRSGPRVVYALGLGLLGAALSLAAFGQALWQFQLCLGLGAGVAAACLGNVPNSVMLSRWFGRRLTAATAIVFSASGLGILTLVPLAQLLVDGLGWRGAYHWLGGAVLLLFVPVLLLPWRTLAAGRPGHARGGQPGAELGGWTLLRAMSHSAFWGLFATFLFTSIGMYAVAVEVVAYLVDVGFPPLTAATAWGFSGVLLPIGMLSVGWLDGLIGRRPSVLLSYVVTLAGIAMLWLLGRFPSVWLLAGFVLCFGSTLGSRGPLISTVAMRLFGGGAVATIFGTIAIGAGLGAATGSWTGGLLHDWSGGYDLVIGFAFLSILCGMLPFLTVPALRR
jgi:MFS family permease